MFFFFRKILQASQQFLLQRLDACLVSEGDAAQYESDDRQIDKNEPDNMFQLPLTSRRFLKRLSGRWSVPILDWRPIIPRDGGLTVLYSVYSAKSSALTPRPLSQFWERGRRPFLLLRVVFPRVFLWRVKLG